MRGLGSGRQEPSSAEARDCIKQTAWGPTYTKHITLSVLCETWRVYQSVVTGRRIPQSCPCN